MNRRQEILNEVGIDTTKVDKLILIRLELAMEKYVTENLTIVKKKLC